MLGKILKLFFGTHNERVLKKIRPLVADINALEPEISKLSDDELKAKTPYLKDKLANGSTIEEILPEAFAVMREVAARTLGMRPYDVQLIGGIALHWGNIAEMKTGEGKTLVATLPIYLNALTGKGVHLVTVNDYLARRDAEWMGPAYKFLGLTVGAIQSNMDPRERQDIYQRDIVYGTNSEFGFDYLRDNMVQQQSHKVQRNHYFTIVDEVDSILIDEARTPLIISGPTEDSTDKYYISDRVIPRLKPAKKGEDGKWLPNSGDYQLEEKDKMVVLSEDGIGTAEKHLGIKDLYHGKNVELVHCIHQALKAHKLFKKDRDYIVEKGQVVIIDENTGRKLEGRRYSDGLHQAIEAKERVSIQSENQTLATITIQNYFKMYDKLSGMTGTAETEAEEFLKIYGMDVLVIPTNKPITRKDNSDLIYRNKKAKYNAIIDEIKEFHKKGAPILVGTIAVETSELLSKLLKRANLPHNVLNAKNHGLEAEIVALSGQSGKITIATNMAGRGTDIVLGGSPNFQAEKYIANLIPKKWLKELAVQLYIFHVFSNDINQALKAIEGNNDLTELKSEKHINYLQRVHTKWKEENKKVLAAGGLHVIGTERHEARRIDNQLRGRSGRQGDAGYTRFYLCLEDDLLRLFGSDRIAPWLSRAGFKEDEAIQHPWINKSIAKAQKRVEGRNFEIRKHLLEYDEVMNAQRKAIYELRDKVLFNKDIKEEIFNILNTFVNQELDFIVGSARNLDRVQMNDLVNRIIQLCGEDLTPPNEITSRIEIEEYMANKLKSIYNDKEEQVGAKVLREVERLILLEVIDNKWKRHLYVIDELQEGIGLRSYGEKNPLVEYKLEAANMFENMLASLYEEVLHILYTASIKSDIGTMEEEIGGEMELGSAEHQQMNLLGQNSNNSKNNKKKRKIGRNEPCPCGSGKKYKVCHGKDQ